MMFHFHVRGRTLLSLLVGLSLVATAAYGQLAPPPGSVTIRNVRPPQGNGCPPGSFITEISDDNLSFTTAFSNYIAEIGDGVPRVRNRRICTLIVDLNIPPGFQFSMVNVDYRGFADLDAGVRGILAAKYFFLGLVGSVRTQTTLDGALFDNYEKRDTFGALTFSPCGGGRPLVSDTSVALSRSGPGIGGILTVDTITQEFKQIFAFVWRTC